MMTPTTTCPLTVCVEFFLFFPLLFSVLSNFSPQTIYLSIGWKRGTDFAVFWSRVPREKKKRLHHVHSEKKKPQVFHKVCGVNTVQHELLPWFRLIDAFIKHPSLLSISESQAPDPCLTFSPSMNIFVWLLFFFFTSFYSLGVLNKHKLKAVYIWVM